MSEMVERIAQAMCREKGQDADAPLLMADGRSYGPPRWQENVSIAIAVIAAMREPTQGMTVTGLLAFVSEVATTELPDNGTEFSRTFLAGRRSHDGNEINAAWRAMIDAALA